MIYSVIHLYSNIIYEITSKLRYSICNSLYACDRLPYNTFDFLCTLFKLNTKRFSLFENVAAN